MSNNKNSKRSTAQTNRVNPKLENQVAVISRPLPRKKESRVDSDLVDRVCGLSDPFCHHANGAKYIDDSPLRTFPFTVHSEKTLTTDINGNVAFTVVPNVTRDSICPTVVVGNTVTPNFLDAAVVPLPTGATRFRITSVGLRVKNVAPSLTASGMVSFRGYSAEDGTQLFSYDGTAYTVAAAKNVPLINVTDECIVLQHTSQMAQNFYKPLQVMPTFIIQEWQAPGYAPVSVLLKGGPASTACLHVEFIMNVEFTFDEGFALGLAVTPAPAFNPVLAAVASRVSSSGIGVFTESANMVYRMVRQKRPLKLLQTM